MTDFNKLVSKYDEWFTKNPYAYRSELKLLKQLIPKNKKGLEIGVGTGQFAAPLSIPEGLDISPKMLARAKQKGIITYLAAAEKLPLPDKTYDYVALITTLCFLKNIPQAFQEIYCVLKPQGKLLIGFVDKDSFLGQHYLQKKNKSVFYKNAKFYSAQDIQNILKENNFKLLKIKQTLFTLPKQLFRVEPVKAGHGKGGFIGILAKKNPAKYTVKKQVRKTYAIKKST